uniref:Uncharacterized protein n=1 Tax=Tetranychus urticae TaxID=32264 RepID=T1JSG7_TETUR
MLIHITIRVTMKSMQVINMDIRNTTNGTEIIMTTITKRKINITGNGKMNMKDTEKTTDIGKKKIGSTRKRVVMNDPGTGTMDSELRRIGIIMEVTGKNEIIMARRRNGMKRNMQLNMTRIMDLSMKMRNTIITIIMIIMMVEVITTMDINTMSINIMDTKSTIPIMRSIIQSIMTTINIVENNGIHPILMYY